MRLYSRVQPYMSEEKKTKGGPRTIEGKAISCKNSLKHGLASSQIIIPGEDPAAFEALVAAFQEDYQPETAVEAVLVHDLAKFHWLKERAIRLQQQAFLSVEAMDPKHLALMIRYQNSNQRAFQSTLKSLETYQRERLKRESEFVSQVVAKPVFGPYDQNGNVIAEQPKIGSRRQEFTDPPGKLA
jgi:hypothetical protein